MKLANITHEEAVMILKSTNDRVKLLVGKPKSSLQPDRSTTASKDHITSPSVAVAEKQHKQSVEKPVKTGRCNQKSKQPQNFTLMLEKDNLQNRGNMINYKTLINCY